jgi:hypothetical protein
VIGYTSRKFDRIATQIQQSQLIECDCFHSKPQTEERAVGSFGEIKKGRPDLAPLFAFTIY